MRAVLSSRRFQIASTVFIAAFIVGTFFLYARFLKPQKTTNIEFILDASGSMTAPIGFESKMEAAKRVLIRRIQQLPDETRAGLRVFSRRTGACNDSELVMAIGALDRRALIGQVRVTQPKGWTPIALSLQRSEEDFPLGKDQVNTVILISDGIETCGGDPCAAAKKLKESGINATIHVIGLGTDAEMDHQFQCIADVTEGSYVAVNDPTTLAKVVGDLVGPSCSWPHIALVTLVLIGTGLLALWPVARFTRY